MAANITPGSRLRGGTDRNGGLPSPAASTRPEGDGCRRPPFSFPRPAAAAAALLCLLVLFGLWGASAQAPAAEARPGDDVLGTWSLPTATDSPEVVQPFAAPPAPWAAGHRGVDLGVAPSAAGAPVFAPADGAVSFVGVVVDRPVLSIDHGEGFASSFEPLETDLELGDAVTAGEQVGQVGGYSSGAEKCSLPCVHWGVRLHGEYINPLLMVGALDPSVLLPLRP